jgi:outer membrane protein assembly factor BamB
MPSRRTVLKAVAGATAVGCAYQALSREPELPDLGQGVSTPFGWPTVGRGFERRGYLPSASPIDDDPSVAWRAPASSRIGYPVVGETVVAYRDLGRVRVLDAASGRRRWSVATVPDQSTEPIDEPVPALSPRLDDRLFVGSTDGDAPVLRAYEVDGSVAWETPTPAGGVIRASPAVFEGRTVVVGTTAGRLFGVDAESGRVDWTRRVFGPVSRTVALDDLDSAVYAAAAGELYALDLDTGRGRWRTDLDAGPLTVPVVADGSVFVGTGQAGVFALDHGTGSVEWQADAGSEVDTFAGVAVGRNRVFAAADGDLIALHPDTGDRLWRRRLWSSTNGSPLITDGDVYVATEEGIRAFDTADPDRRTILGLDTRPRQFLAATADRLYVPVSGPDGDSQLLALE